MKILLKLSALLEFPTGVALLGMPATVVHLLLAVPLDQLLGATIARLAGAALVGLGTACWGASRDAESRAASSVVAGMLLYNLGAVTMFVYCRGFTDMHGVALVPAALIHAAMALWCVKCLRGSK